MPTVTSTFFGLTIAFVAPGALVLYAASLYSKAARDTLGGLLGTEAGLPGLLVLGVSAVIVGLVLSAIRSFLYESDRWRCGKGAESPPSPTKADFTKLASGSGLAAYRALIDEIYRYHQFHGAVSLTAPFLLIHWLASLWSRPPTFCFFAAAVVSIALEFVLIWAAVSNLTSYSERASEIFGRSASQEEIARGSPQKDRSKESPSQEGSAARGPPQEGSTQEGERMASGAGEAAGETLEEVVGRPTSR